MHAVLTVVLGSCSAMNFGAKNSFHFFFYSTSLFQLAVYVRLPAGALLCGYSRCVSDAVSHVGSLYLFVILFMPILVEGRDIVLLLAILITLL